MKYTTAIHDNYNLITLQTPMLDLAEVAVLENDLNQQFTAGINAVIVAINEVENISIDACHGLAAIHHKIYEAGNSIAFTEPSELVYKKLKQEQLHLVMNICPTMQEAIDIIHMEILERDLLGEE